jgi:hypothetical protein
MFGCYPQVSWIRKRDLHILTAGIYTYTSDARFQVRRNIKNCIITQATNFYARGALLNNSLEARARPQVGCLLFVAVSLFNVLKADASFVAEAASLIQPTPLSLSLRSPVMNFY